MLWRVISSGTYTKEDLIEANNEQEAWDKFKDKDIEDTDIDYNLEDIFLEEYE